MKATTASVIHTSKKTNEIYLINLFDSPGHVDFSKEVDRCLDVVEGGVILFDACQGVQAQTVSVYEKARKRGVKMVPVLTKVDMENSKPLEICLSVSEVFGEFDPDEIVLTSARENLGIEELLEEVRKRREECEEPKRGATTVSSSALRRRSSSLTRLTLHSFDRSWRRCLLLK